MKRLDVLPLLRSLVFPPNCRGGSVSSWNKEVITIYIINSVMHAFWLVLAYDLLEDRLIDAVIIKTFLILYYIKQIDSKLLCVCSVIDHRGPGWPPGPGMLPTKLVKLALLYHHWIRPWQSQDHCSPPEQHEFCPQILHIHRQSSSRWLPFLQRLKKLELQTHRLQKQDRRLFLQNMTTTKRKYGLS